MSRASGSPPASRDWDADTYHRVSGPQLEWGLEVLARLPLSGDETVLDAGCGSGRVTAELLERLPNGSVIAVDAAPSMVAAAREVLPADRVDVRACDLLELELESEVDAVFSTATFHWIADHARLYSVVHRSLRPGGRLVAQCGGEGNIAGLHTTIDEVGAREPFCSYLARWQGPWNYASAQDTEQRLQVAGFDQIHCWLEPRLTIPPDPPAFLRSVCLRAHLDRLPAELRGPFVAAVLAESTDAAGRVEIDYVRLNIDARRPA